MSFYLCLLMDHNLPPVNWLRAFESAGRHSSFAMAATELHLTPASISQQIRALEHRLGFKLFKRLGRGVELTDMGEAYMQPVRKTFAELAAATSGLFGVRSKKTINIRCTMSYASTVLAPILAKFHALYPDIGIQLCSTVWAKAMDDDSIDIDIRYGDGKWHENHIRRLGYDFAIPVCSPDYYRQISTNLTLEKLSQSQNIQVMGDQFQWTNLFHHYGVEREAATEWIKVDTHIIALQYAVAGTGCALVLESHAKQFLELGLLVQPLDVKIPIDAAYYLVLRDDADTIPEVNQFCDWLLTSSLDYRPD